MTAPRLPDSFFDAMYADTEDPWGFGTRWYEQRKYALTLAALPARRYRSAFEPGCSLGILTAQLATRCDTLLATDVSEAALRAATERLSDAPHVDIQKWALGDEWPQRSFDLIVFSEVCYYLEPTTLVSVLASATVALEPSGTLLAAHWRHPVAEYLQTGDDVHAALSGTAGLERMARYADDDMLLEVFARTPPAVRSVAAHEGFL